MEVNLTDIYNSKIIGIGSKVPEKVVTNFDLEDIVDTDDKWIRKRTGIHERRVVTTETCTSMAIDSVHMALEHAGIEANDVGLMIGSTITAEYLTPALAGIVQREIGCQHAISFDISAGCTAFVYGLSIAASMMQTMDIEYAVVFASEVLSTRINWEDRSTCVLFGDGAGAVVLKRSDCKGVKFPILDNIPDVNDVLFMQAKQNNNPWTKDKQNDDVSLYMKGMDVFEFATGAMAETINKLEDLMGKGNINKIITHQANSRIIKFAASNTNFDKSQFYVTVDQYANTSSSTIPIAMRQAYEEKWLEKGDEVALVGFGAGLTYGGIVITWDID